MPLRSLSNVFNAIPTLGCLIGLCATTSGSLVFAGDVPVVQGSTPTHRAQVDGLAGQVYIYVGGSLPAGTNLRSFQFLFDFSNAGNTTGYITPVLFNRSPGELYETYTVAGIGRGFEVAINSAPQAIPFELIEGVEVPTADGQFTFGYINALVNSGGVPVAISPGTVDYDNPGDGGRGVAGAGTTNDWVATDVGAQPSPVVALGTTFSIGARTDYSFATYDSTVVRTYSARAIGILATQ